MGKTAGGIAIDSGNGVAVDVSGNVYVTGAFAGTAIFAPGEPNQTTLKPPGSLFITQVFLAKYNTSGVLEWVKRAGGDGFGGSYVFGSAIAVDSSGNSYVTGSFEGTITFGPGEANETTLVPTGRKYIFIAKYNVSGALEWVRHTGGTVFDFDSGKGIGVDGAGNSYVTGNFQGSMTFGAGQANQTTLISAGACDIFVAKYNAGGIVQWARKSGGSAPAGYEPDAGKGIAVDTSGNSYVAGTFINSATFGAGQTNETTLTAAGGNDIFVAKYNTNGALVWAKRAGGAVSYDIGNGVALDGSGNAYLTGFFNVTATFGTGEANETTLIDAGQEDIFVAKFSAGFGVPLDFDGDGKSDVGIYRPEVPRFGTWLVRQSSDDLVSNVDLGEYSLLKPDGYIPVPADYDGDGIADRAVYSTGVFGQAGVWVIKRSSDRVTDFVGHGHPDFLPIPADYDGDGKADVAVYGQGVWAIRYSTNPDVVIAIAHGGLEWTGVAADYDGDGKADLAVYRDGAWSVKRSSDNTIAVTAHGGPGWEPVPGDYDGDGKADIAVYINGAWSIKKSSDNAITVVGHGGPGWIPVPADYDGDGKTDIAVYHPVGAWSILQSSTNTIRVVAHGGGPTDVPVN